jgi:two-component system chemotaxis response regulator CheY
MEQCRVVVGRRILLVEDQIWVRQCIKRLLALDEHTVTEAANGVEGSELFSAGKFDLVITDYDMPKMNGDQFAARIRSVAPSQPIIMITACAERLTGQENPVNAVLAKPFGVAELRQILASLLS